VVDDDKKLKDFTDFKIHHMWAGHKLRLKKFQDTNYVLSLLILSFTATPAVPKLLPEWQVGELATSVLLMATEGCLQFAFSLERCMYI